MAGGCGKLAGSVIAIETRAILLAQDVLVSIGIDNAAIVKSRWLMGTPTAGP